MPESLARPLVLVIFGITGDLAKRKLLPALYHLQKAGQITDNLQIVGVSRRTVDARDVLEGLQDSIQAEDYDQAIVDRLRERTVIEQMDLTTPADYEKMLNTLRQTEDRLGADSVRLYYLSVPPGAVAPIVRHLGETGHNQTIGQEHDRPRLMVEKPFGHDLASAQELIATIQQHFGEEQIYRIDHYLARETAQNILTFRFENPLFEAVWNSQQVEHITVLAHESIGIEGRANFYEGVGALRDLLQSHLLQLMAITTMPQPSAMTSEQIHAQKLALLQAVKPVEPTNVVRAQYVGYREEVSNPNSNTETFARARLTINNNQWRGVPITLETGKALDRKATEVIVCFQQASSREPEQNQLIFRIQPDEGITLHLQAKRPGIDNFIKPVEMKFDYGQSFEVRQLDPYERVIIDAMRGDQTLFASADEVIASWTIFEPVLQAWTASDAGLSTYQKGAAATDIESVSS